MGEPIKFLNYLNLYYIWYFDWEYRGPYFQLFWHKTISNHMYFWDILHDSCMWTCITQMETRQWSSSDLWIKTLKYYAEHVVFNYKNTRKTLYNASPYYVSILINVFNYNCKHIFASRVFRPSSNFPVVLLNLVTDVHRVHTALVLSPT